MLSYEKAREKVIEVTRKLAKHPASELVSLLDGSRRVLAGPIVGDRDYPPFDRSTRDGFVVRASDARAGAALSLVGEIRAGAAFTGEVKAGECVEIMTGGAVPAGADSVVMLEYARVD